MFEDIVRPGIVLFIITVVVSALLGVANAMTAPVIAENEIIAKNKAMAEVLSGVSDNKFAGEVFTGNETGVTSYDVGYAGDDVYGYAVSVAVKGYGGTIKLLVGIKADGTVEGIKIISHDETAGLGANATNKKFTDQYKDKTGKLSVIKSGSPTKNEIEAITSATITSKAVTDGVNSAIDFYRDVLSKGAVRQ